MLKPHPRVLRLLQTFDLLVSFSPYPVAGSGDRISIKEMPAEEGTVSLSLASFHIYAFKKSLCFRDAMTNGGCRAWSNLYF